MLSMRPLSGATEYGEPERQRKRDAPRRGAGGATLDGTRSRPLYYSNHASFSIQQVEENVLPKNLLRPLRVKQANCYGTEAIGKGK
jgi:hypothetical protein